MKFSKRPTLRQLDYFAAVADRSSFHAAAEACHVSQPGLSAQIRQLETGLGVQLFERDSRRVLITAQGRALLDRARAVLAAAEALVEAAEAADGGLRGPFAMGVIPTVAPYVLPRVLPAVRASYPDLRMRLREDKTSVLVDLLFAGDLDLLLLALEADLGNAETAAILDDEFVLAAPPGHPLARGRAASQEDLIGAEVLLLEDGHCLREQALDVCRLAGASEAGDFRASSLGTLAQMVAGGNGVTLLPSVAVNAEARPGSGIVVRKFRRPRPRRTIGLAWRPTAPRAEAFQQLAGMMSRVLRGKGS